MSGTRTRLDQAMDQRRLDLRKQWKDIATAAGVSTAALGAIRRGEYKPSPLTARGIEDALQWGHGSIEAILAGDEPTPGTPQDVTDSGRAEDELGVAREPTVAELAARVAELQATVDEILGRNREDQGKAG